MPSKRLAVMGLLGLKQCSLLLLCRWYASVVEEDESKRFVMSRNSHQLSSPMASVLKQSKAKDGQSWLELRPRCRRAFLLRVFYR